MPTYPLPTLAATVNSTGISTPAYSDILASLVASYQSIFGVDSYLSPDSQDYQLLAVFAQAIYDSNQTAVAVYNQFSPATAQGTGLSSVVKINGIRPTAATYSTVATQIIGTAGTILTNASVTDASGYSWTLPTTTIPSGGSITVTATCTTVGAITAGAQNVTIATPTYGWQSAAFTASASPGVAQLTDAAIRSLQSMSTAIPALSILGGLVSAIANIPSVENFAVYENDTNTTNALGLPAHSLAVVVEGGDATTITQTIERKKGIGATTVGTTSVIVTDTNGIPITIKYYIPTQVTILVNITIKALNGYVSTTGTAIETAIVTDINNLGIYANQGLLSLSLLYAAAYSAGNTTSYNITSLTIARSPSSPAAADLAIAFNELPICALANVTLTVT